MHPQQVGVPVRARPRVSPVAVVLLWVVVGWPLSWLLLFVFAPVGLLFGIGITVAMIVVLATSPRRVPVVLAWPVPGPPGWAPVDEVRRQVESLASIDAVGGCGWCGSRIAHVNDGGYPVHPRHWHAGEIEEHLRVTRPRSGWGVG